MEGAGMRVLLIAVSVFVSFAALAEKREPEEIRAGLVMAIQKGGLDAAKTYFENNKEWVGENTNKNLLHVGNTGKIRGDVLGYMDLKDIERKIQFDQELAKEIKDKCASDDERKLKSCRDMFSQEICDSRKTTGCPIYADKVENTPYSKYAVVDADAIFTKLWISTDAISEAKASYVAGLTKLNQVADKKIGEKNAESQKVQADFQAQQKMCDKNKRKYLVKALVKIVEKVGKGLLNTELVTVQSYLCGGMDAAQWLPKVFVMKGVSNPKQNHCASVILGSAEKVKLPNKQGFAETWQVWQVVQKPEVLSKLYEAPTWYPCP